MDSLRNDHDYGNPVPPQPVDKPETRRIKEFRTTVGGDLLKSEVEPKDHKDLVIYRHQVRVAPWVPTGRSQQGVRLAGQVVSWIQSSKMPEM